MAVFWPLDLMLNTCNLYENAIQKISRKYMFCQFISHSKFISIQMSFKFENSKIYDNWNGNNGKKYDKKA